MPSGPAAGWPSRSIARFAFAAFAALGGAAASSAQISPAELEVAAEDARRLAASAARDQDRALVDALDAEAILRDVVSPSVWRQLTARQQQALRASLGTTFATSLAAPARAGTGEVAWSWARADGALADVFLGLRWDERVLKTRWVMKRAAAEWRVEDVTLSDPGISLAALSRRTLGARPVRARDRRLFARQEAIPRLLGLAAIVLAVAVSYTRVKPERRSLLLMTASAPAFLFAFDGALAVRRALAEPFTVVLPSGPAPLERWKRLAREAEQADRIAEAEPLWTRAVAAGASPQPIAYERGLAARDRGDSDRARALFESALEGAEPAPGAARELALIDLARGESAAAETHLRSYLDATGPDPDALSLLAVAEINLGRPPLAVDAIRRARELVGGGVRGAELEARIRARAGDAAGAVAALGEVEGAGKLDREATRSDPAYLSIAEDPAWVAFLNREPPTASATPAIR